MVLTKDFYLPSEEKLTVPEVNLSASTLRAASFHLGKYCEEQNNEFMLCRYELKDPRKCLEEGKMVTSCSLEFFRLLKKNCFQQFNQHAHCLDKSSGDYAFSECRKTQAIYDECVLSKMNMPRADYGYFCRARIHDTKRPAPPAPKKAVYPDAVPALPEDYPKPPAKYGSRFGWLTE